MGTTDLHMQIMPYDYFSDSADPARGLVQLADRITALRADTSGLTLLFDNGDFLQGNPLADTVVQAEPDGMQHPMIAAFAALRYDAVGLGNHEFNFGLPFLRRALRDPPCPVVCANIDWRKEVPVARPFVLLDRVIHCDDGRNHPLRIGVVGFVPPQFTQWDRVTLGDAITCHDIVTSAREIVPRIKAAGADVIVALCHAGIGDTEHVPGMENAAVPLAAVPGIDAVLTGHTHEIFPGTTRPAGACVDPVAGRLHGKPAVGAGFFGNALGMITLMLRRDACGWHVSDSTAQVIPADATPPQSEAARAIVAAVGPAHDTTLRLIRQPVAGTLVPLHSYFACAAPDLPGQILGDALIAHAASMLPDHDMPIVAAVSPIRAGGLGGPAHYIAIPPGPVTLRDLCAIYPYADTPVIVQRTGSELRDWLEQAVSGYRQIRPGLTGQPLLNPDFAAYVFDSIHGLQYEIDLTQPPRHDASGRVTAPGARRISLLHHKGKTVQPDDRFALVVNSYRAFGGGGFAPIPAHDVLALPRVPIRDILASSLQDRQVIDAALQAHWRFAPIPGASAVFTSAPVAREHLDAQFQHVGAATGGFDSYKMTFPDLALLSGPS